ncbi:hypothetical protein C8R45DRAFT_936996 [Mycena sanguinolenta]|nr:hypothetical protein C8R45DRAFT_936996 [Mycena sanguinolenta]
MCAMRAMCDGDEGKKGVERMEESRTFRMNNPVTKNVREECSPQPQQDDLEVRTRGQGDEECDDNGEISATRTLTLRERKQFGRDIKTKMGRTSIANCGWEQRRWTLKEMKTTKSQAWSSKKNSRDTEPNESLLRERV